MLEVPKAIYRYRPFNALTLKELLYGELYYAKVSELNDPYDSIICYLFDKNINNYLILIEQVFSKIIGFEVFKRIDCQGIALFLAENELTYEELIDRINTSKFKKLLINSLIKEFADSKTIAEVLIRQLKIYIHKNLSYHRYIVSFSKKSYDPIMWAHYANNHNGICLQFVPFMNKICENPETISPQQNKARLELNDVIYKDEIKPLNGFLRINIHGINTNKNAINEYWKNFQESSRRKSLSWKYEDEVRLIDDDYLPNKITENGTEPQSSLKRLFYFDQTQFIGIIFGANLKQANREEIITTVEAMRNTLQSKAWGLPIFIFYEAKINARKYALDIMPILGLNCSNNRFLPETDDIILAEIQKAKNYISSLKTSEKDMLNYCHYKNNDVFNYKKIE